MSARGFTHLAVRSARRSGEIRNLSGSERRGCGEHFLFACRVCSFSNGFRLDPERVYRQLTHFKACFFRKSRFFTRTKLLHSFFRPRPPFCVCVHYYITFILFCKREKREERENGSFIVVIIMATVGENNNTPKLAENNNNGVGGGGGKVRKREYGENEELENYYRQDNNCPTTNNDNTNNDQQQQQQRGNMSTSSSMQIVGGFKRLRTGDAYARRLIDVRGFEMSHSQLGELARFIDLLPRSLEPTIAQILEECLSIDDAIVQLSSLQTTTSGGGNTPTVTGNGGGQYQYGGAACSTHDTNGCESEVVAEARDLALRTSQEDLTSPQRLSYETRIPDGADRTTPATSENGAQHHHRSTNTNNANVAFRSNKTSLDAGEWVSALVREMQSASSVSDAEHRATNVLRAFEESTREQAEIEIKRIRKQNELLKRAVTIQNARLKQSGDAQTLKRQVAELQNMCQSYEEQLATAQRNNYSLGVHLREAMMNNGNGNNPNGGPGGSPFGDPNRDVF